MDAPLSRLDVIAKVREHFSKPTAQFAISVDGSACVYRMGDDPNSATRCAMGVCIPNDLYDPLMEGKTASAIMRGFTVQDAFPNRTIEIGSLERLFASDVTSMFLDTIQEYHDSCARSVNSGNISRDQGIKELMAKLRNMEDRISASLRYS